RRRSMGQMETFAQERALRGSSSNNQQSARTTSSALVLRRFTMGYQIFLHADHSSWHQRPSQFPSRSSHPAKLENKPWKSLRLPVPFWRPGNKSTSTKPHGERGSPALRFQFTDGVES